MRRFLDKLMPKPEADWRFVSQIEFYYLCANFVCRQPIHMVFVLVERRRFFFFFRLLRFGAYGSRSFTRIIEYLCTHMTLFHKCKYNKGKKAYNMKTQKQQMHFTTRLMCGYQYMRNNIYAKRTFY